MRHANRRAAGLSATLFLVLLVGAPALGTAAEPAPAAKPGAEEANPSTAGAGKARREMPSEMILCRGPRGAVYARDAAEGCRYSRLTPENLVDFGAGSGCLLRRATAPAKGESTKTAADAKSPTSCEDLCAAEKDGRACVVGLRQASAGGWETFPSTERFAPGDESFRAAIAVCCGR